MNTVVTILLALAGLIALLLIIGLFMKKDHFVQRDIVINAPVEKVFDFLRFLKNQEKFNKWAKADADRHATTKGTDGTVGYVYAWNGDKSVGEGEKEILSIDEGKKIETEIRFVRPMKTSARVTFVTRPLTENQTKVSFCNAGNLAYPFNIMIPMFQKNFGKEMGNSLITLKNILEQ